MQTMQNSDIEISHQQEQIINQDKDQKMNNNNLSKNNQNFQEFSRSNQKFSTLQQYPPQFRKCIGSYQLTQFCISPYCHQSYKFTCSNMKCECNLKHLLCGKGKINIVLQKINQKVCDNINKLKQQIHAFFIQFIEQVKQYQKQIINQVDEIKVYQLLQVQKQFYQYFNKKNYQNYHNLHNNEDKNHQNILNGKQILKLWENLQLINNKSQHFLFEFLYNLQYLNGFFKQDQRCIKNYMKNQIDKFEDYKKNYEVYWQNQRNVLSSSSIIKNGMDYYKLLNFFDNNHNHSKKIKKLSLMFKASEHDFKISKYYQKCGQLSNTLILIQTQRQKILGGYTPLQFLKKKSIKSFIKILQSHQNQLVQDKSRQSFIFSLSQNIKFSLFYPSDAILRDVNKSCINFGDGFIKLFDEANKYENNVINLKNHVYRNQMYNLDYCNNNDQEKLIYLKINGGEKKEFKVKQWEVWKLHVE